MAGGKITLTTPKNTVEGYIKWSSEAGPVSGNYSLVSASIYLRKTDGYTSWGTFSGSLKIAGNSYSFSKNVTIGSSYVLLASKSGVKVTHNSDGTRNITIGADFRIPDTTIAGNYSASKTVALDTIKRLSYSSGPFDITAGEKFVLNITRYSASHLHDVTIKIDGKTVRQVWNYGERITFNSDEFHAAVFTALAGRLSAKCTIELVTKSNGNELGSRTYTGTVTAYSPGQLTASLSSVYIGQTQGIAVQNVCSLYDYAASYDFGEVKGQEVPLTAGAGRLDIDTVFAQNMSSSVNESECRVTVNASYAGIQIGTPMEISFLVKLTQEQRSIVFQGTDAAYSFLNEDLTGSAQKFINGAGTVRMVIPEEKRAQSFQKGYISSYQLKMGGAAVTVPGTGSGDVILELTAGTGRVLELLIMDSRGNTKLCTYTVSEADFIDYVPLQIKSCSIYRENGFDKTVKVKLKAAMWKGNFGAAENTARFVYSVAASAGAKPETPPPVAITEVSEDGSIDTVFSLVSGAAGGDFASDSSYRIDARVEDGISAAEKTVEIPAAIIGMYLKRNQNSYHLGVNCTPSAEELAEGSFREGLSVKGGFELDGDASVNGKLQLQGDFALNGMLQSGGYPVPRVIKSGDGFVQLDLGTHLFSMNWGKTLAQVTETGTPVSTPVSFEPGLFTEKPSITLGARSGVIGSVIKGVSFNNEDENGCDIVVYRTNKTNFYVHWHAVLITVK